MKYLLFCQTVQPSLFIRRLFPRTNPRTRDVRSVSHRAHHISIKGDKITGANLSTAAFLEPGVCASPGCEKATLHPFSAMSNIDIVHDSPELALLNAGAKCVTHQRDPSVTDVDRQTQRRNLFLAFDHS